MKITVIGGVGFVGQYLVNELHQNEDHNITATSLSHRNNLHIPIDKLPRVQIESGVDVLDYDSLLKCLSGADIVFNLAGLLSFLQKDKKKLVNINHNGAMNVLRACERLGIKKLIHISSTASLGFGDKIINENSTFNWNRHNKCVYSISKSLSNKKMMESGCNTVVVYPALILGAGDNVNSRKLFNAIRDRKLPFISPGTNSIIDVRDFAKAGVLIMDSDNTDSSYIVASENITYKKLYSMIADAFNVAPPMIHLPKYSMRPLLFFSKIIERISKNPPITYENIFMSFQKRNHCNDRIKKIGYSPRFSVYDTIDDIKSWMQ